MSDRNPGKHKAKLLSDKAKEARNKVRASDDGGAGGPWPPHFFPNNASMRIYLIFLNSL